MFSVLFCNFIYNEYVINTFWFDLSKLVCLTCGEGQSLVKFRNFYRPILTFGCTVKKQPLDSSFGHTINLRLSYCADWNTGGVCGRRHRDTLHSRWPWLLHQGREQRQEERRHHPHTPGGRQRNGRGQRMIVCESWDVGSCGFNPHVLHYSGCPTDSGHVFS